MPTGYTADVADGKVTDFRTFALRCARAFGACVMQRDDPMNDEPKRREKATYYGERVTEARARVRQLADMRESEAEAAAQAEYEKAMAYRAERIEENTLKRNRYNAMLADVIGWAPPSDDHRKLKDFMVEQLKDGREFDCNYVPEMPARLSGSMWLEKERIVARANLDSAERSAREEEERVANANSWIDALYKSLPVAEPVSA